MKIAIAGPGRSGTSLLVKLFGAWGFSIPTDDKKWYETAQAGLESRLGSGSDFEIEKDPWAYQYLHKLSDEQVAEYSTIIVPIRNLNFAATSRAVQERLSRKDSAEMDFWAWRDWGGVPGGAVYPTTVDEIERTLARGLWQLLDVASARGMNIVILNFPKFSSDFDYLWGQLSPLVATRVSEEEARKAWANIVDPTSIRITQPEGDLTVTELTGLVNHKSAELRKVQSQLSRVKAELLGLHNQASENLAREAKETKQAAEAKAAKEARGAKLELEIARAKQELQEFKQSRSWRYTKVLRTMHLRRQK